MPVPIRLIPLARAGGAWNMAADEAVLEAVAAGDAPPTLRFYGWRGSWLSLGMAESVCDVDADACRRLGTRLVRRPSGGAAVLHAGQLAWSLALPDGHPLAPPDIVRSYEQQAELTIEALRELGVAARPATPAEAKEPLPDPVLGIACFGGLAPHEILVGQPPRKLVGWGQVRRRGVVMHHAVLSTRFEPGALPARLVVDRPRLTSALAARVVGLDETAGRRVGSGELVAALVGALARRGWPTSPGRLSGQERRRASELLRLKYGQESWTARR